MKHAQIKLDCTCHSEGNRFAACFAEEVKSGVVSAESMPCSGSLEFSAEHRAQLARILVRILVWQRDGGGEC